MVGQSAVQRSPLRRVTLDVLNQASFLAVVAACIATSTIGLAHLNRHYRVVQWAPALAFARPAPANDLAARQEAGLIPPSVPPPATGPAVPVAPLVQNVVPALPVGAKVSPTSETYWRPALTSGTWIPILMYHYVRVAPRYDRVGEELSVSPSEFTRQMLYLREHEFDTLTMRDVDLILSGQKALPPRPVALTFDDGYADFATTAAPIMKALGITATNYVPTGLVGQDRYMSWADIQSLDAAGFEMAAHTEMHVDLSKATYSRAKLEIEGAKADLESHLGHQVVDFAYPYGGFNKSVVELVREAGYWSATTTIGGSYHDARQLLVLTRQRVSGSETLMAWEHTLQAPS